MMMVLNGVNQPPVMETETWELPAAQMMVANKRNTKAQVVLTDNPQQIPWVGWCIPYWR